MSSYHILESEYFKSNAGIGCLATIISIGEMASLYMHENVYAAPLMFVNIFYFLVCIVLNV